MTAVAAAVAIPDAAPGQDAEDVDDDASWLRWAAAPDDRFLSLQTRSAAQDAADSIIGRCVAIIKDGDAHVYRRGMAVLALGRTLQREVCKDFRRSTSTQKFGQVLYDLYEIGEQSDAEKQGNNTQPG